jgi:DUF1009 family protein
VLAVEAGRTIVVDAALVAAAAGRLRVSIVSCFDDAGAPALDARAA